MVVAALREPQIRNLHSILRAAPIIPGRSRAGLHYAHQPERNVLDAPRLAARLELIADQSRPSHEGEDVLLGGEDVEGAHGALDELDVWCTLR